MPKTQKLYEGWLRTERLVALTDFTIRHPITGQPTTPTVAATRRDLNELWDKYLEGAQEAGCKPDLVDFAAWVLGKNIKNPDIVAWYGECEPAEVIW